MTAIPFPPPTASRSEVDAFYRALGVKPPLSPVLHEEVAEHTSTSSSTRWIRFDGQNCTAPCRGWDGVSYRCDCGSRRVFWDTLDGVRYARTD